MAIRITCVSKPGGSNRNSHEAIAILGWLNEEDGQQSRITRLDLYEWIKTKNGTAYVVDAKGNKAFVSTREVNGTRFVQTHADGVWTDNLLSLPNC